MLNIKVSLVTSSGLLLASKPETLDDTKQILATGLVTALISFSKEVHQRELQSISYHDRTVSFIRVHEFVLILETIDEEASLSEKRLEQLLEQLRVCTEPILEGVDPNQITEGEAAIILDRCLQEIQLVQYSITEQPFKMAESVYFTISHSKTGWEIKDKSVSDSLIQIIASMLDNLKANEKCKGLLKGLIIRLPEEKKSVFVIIDTDGKTSKVGVIKIPQELDFVLFRLFTIMDYMLQDMSKNKNNTSMEKIIDTIKEIDDPGNRLSNISLEDLSPSFLERTVGKNIDKAIYSAVVGDPIFVIGDKPTVKLLIDTLSIFTQHIQTSVNLWVIENSLVKSGKCDLSSRICGMSKEIFEILTGENIITDDDTCINLMNSKISGIKSSIHFNKLYDTIKRLPIAELVTKIALELEKIVSFSMDLTTISLVEENKGKQKYKEISSNSGYSNSFIRKALELAVKRNFLLDYLL